MTCGDGDSCLVAACYHWDKHSTVCRHIFRNLVLGDEIILVLINFGLMRRTACFHAQSADIRLDHVRTPLLLTWRYGAMLILSLNATVES